jgi:2-keto-4-pentenoate hydratase
MDQKDIQQAADALWAAEKGAYQIPMISIDHPEMTIDDAYAIQLKNVERHLAEGDRLVGMKIGLTSKGMQKLLGVDVPDYGHLTDRMLLLEGQLCPAAELNQPKVEGELAFCLKKTLKGPGITLAHVYDATDYVVPALEIVDSRIKDWKIKLVDTIADNGSSARLVVGSRMTPIHQVDMRLTGMNLEKNGELVNSGTTAEVWGNPAAAVAWLANQLSAYGIELKAGSIVLAGALTAALPVQAGDTIRASFSGLGSVSVKFS